MTAPVPAHRHPGRSKRHLRRTRAPTGSKDDSGRHHWHGAVRGNSPELFNPPYLPAGTLRPTSKVADLLSIPDAVIECYARNVTKVCKVCRVCRRVNIVQRLARLDPALGTRWLQVAIPLLLLLLFLLLLTVSNSWLHPLTVPSSILAPHYFHFEQIQTRVSN